MDELVHERVRVQKGDVRAAADGGVELRPEPRGIRGSGGLQGGFRGGQGGS